MDVLHNVLFMGASQGLLLIVIILSLKAANPAANRYLALFVALESLHLFCLYLIYTDTTAAPVLALRLLFGFRVLAAPSLYLYICAMTGDRIISPARILRHCWPVLPMLLWFFLLLVDDHWARQSTVELQQALSTMLLAMFVTALAIGYGWAARQRLNQHSLRLEQALSAVDNGDLRWLRWLVVAIITANSCFMLLDILRVAGVMGVELKITLNVISTILLIYIVSIGGLRQPAVFTHSVQQALTALDSDSEEADVEDDKASNKYAKSGLNEEQIKTIWERLGQLMTQQQPYLDYSLDLPKLAKMLDVRPQELSQVINTASDGTFYQLISQQRIKAAQALLADASNDHLKMLDIALAVGFSSQSTFYGQFKKLTGMTPVAYRKKCQLNPALTTPQP